MLLLRKRYITLEIETTDGRPEDWDWHHILFDGRPGNSVEVVNVEEA